MELLFHAIDLYTSKIRTGNYEHYTPEMLSIMFEECIEQVVMMRHSDDSKRK